jgi:hypothetical protein
MNAFKKFAGVEVDEAAEETKFTTGCALSKRQRIIGFCSCLAVGLIITILSAMSLLNPMRFSLLYTTGESA